MENTMQSIIARDTLKNHKIEILEIIEVDMDGNPVLSKKMVLVDTPTNGRQVMNVSPFGSAKDFLMMARMWIPIGCPTEVDSIGMPRKWTVDSLLKHDTNKGEKLLDN